MSLFAFFLFMGFIAALSLTVKVESRAGETSKLDPVAKKIQLVQKEIDQTASKNAVLESEMLIVNHSITKTLQEKQKNEMAKLAMLTGMQEKEGEGLIVRLSDNEKPLQVGETPGTGIVHNVDLINVANSLWAGGAKAVSINGRRITSLTEINCIGPTILIDKERVVPPYIVKAVGNPDPMEKSLHSRYVQKLPANGIKYIVEKYSRLKIPADGNIILAGET